MSPRRYGLRKHATEGKGALGVWEKETKKILLGKESGEKHTGSFGLWFCIWKSQGPILIEYYSSALQVCPYNVVASIDWLAPGQGDSS